MNDSHFSCCVVIPVYNHAGALDSVLARLSAFELPCVLVNDGSDQQTTAHLRQLVQNDPALVLEEQFPNRGKGAAVLRGFRRAQALGYSHAIQVDADGQRDIDDVPKLLDCAKNNPRALVTGVPVYDQSVPKSRLVGRYITHFWVWVETLSFAIKDSMCGFRVYPLADALALADRVTWGQRMDFDTDVMVRLYWQGCSVISIPTAVRYPEDGVSHFRLWRDNLLISWMHTRLVLGMLPRIPRLLKRNVAEHNRFNRDES